MSYSFGKVAATKVLAIAALQAGMTEVVASQPVHEVDKDHALKVAEETLAFLEPTDKQQINVSMSGSIYKTAEGVQNLSVSVHTHLSLKPVPPEEAKAK